MPIDYPYRYAWRLVALWGPQESPLFNRRCRTLAQLEPERSKERPFG